TVSCLLVRAHFCDDRGPAQPNERSAVTEGLRTCAPVAVPAPLVSTGYENEHLDETTPAVTWAPLTVKVHLVPSKRASLLVRPCGPHHDSSLERGPPVLADSYGRVATDLRVSLPDRCNLRCTYCMPPEGLEWLPKPELLDDDELLRLISIGVTRLGITEIRFTGGEPLLRRGLPGIIAGTTDLHPRPRTALTTNGIGLARTAPALAEAGLDRVN